MLAQLRPGTPVTALKTAPFLTVATATGPTASPPPTGVERSIEPGSVLEVTETITLSSASKPETSRRILDNLNGVFSRKVGFP